MLFGRSKNGTTFADVLRGTTAGRLQRVGYMQVIPLTGDPGDDRFVSPVEGETEISTSDYGTLDFHNRSDATLIVPCHAAYIVKHAVQDHAMAHAAVVESHEARSFDTAMCVQSTQCGLIGRGVYQMMILPFALREQALEMRREREFGKLWPAISEFNQRMGITGASHLDLFLKRFRKELDEFVAEFECVPDQVGAVILVDDQVVGIERAPSSAYWQSVWRCLIRECYGSLAIQVARRRKETVSVPSTRIPLPERVRSLDELSAVLGDIAADEDERAKQIVGDLLDEKLSTEVDEAVDGLTLETLSPGRFVGQIVRDGKRIIYASLPASRRWRTLRHR